MIDSIINLLAEAAVRISVTDLIPVLTETAVRIGENLIANLIAIWIITEISQYRKF